MRYRSLVGISIATALSLSAPTPAFAQSTYRIEETKPAAPLSAPTPAFAQSTYRIEKTNASAAVPARTPAVAPSAYRIEQTKAAALKWELSYLALSAIDAAQTIHCLKRDICEEANPIFGKDPSAQKLILAKVGLGLAHFAVFSHLNDRNPKAALRLAQVSCAVQGGVVLVNMRLTFK